MHSTGENISRVDSSSRQWTRTSRLPRRALQVMPPESRNRACCVRRAATTRARISDQTTGQSAFTMLHPGLAASLDHPDVASIACPMPMMFLCGSRDALFPVQAIRDAFERMREVWASQGASDRLVTRLYDAPHEFNAVMQDDAFQRLDRVTDSGDGAARALKAAPNAREAPGAGDVPTPPRSTGIPANSDARRPQGRRPARATAYPSRPRR